jgi:ABC-type oligopeptide transport system ATPase subunit
MTEQRLGLVVERLRVEFVANSSLARKSSALVAVDDVSFSIAPGETLAIVGESGSGKTTIARTLVRLQKAVGGTALLDGREVLKAQGKALRDLRRRIQLVFQDPHSSMSPRMTVAEILTEPFKLNPSAAVDVPRRVADLLDSVGLRASHADRLPHELSGGQLQRVGIARALALEPTLIICDEAVSALDVSVQAQVLNLLADLQERTGVAYLFISHDLAVVRHIADNVLVMRRGAVVEHASTKELFAQPQQRYTRELLDAIPIVGRRRGVDLTLQSSSQPDSR